MKRITSFFSFAAVVFFLAGASYFFLSEAKAGAVITNVNAINIIGTGAQITWNTDIPSDSRVAYGTGINLGSFSNSRCDAGGYVTSHCVNLTGLTANTVYYYKVESMTTGGWDNFLGGFQFTSATGGGADISFPSVPAEVTVATVSSAQIKLSWGASTDNVGVSGYNVYRNGNFIATTPDLFYSDTGLIPSTSYSYTVSAADAAGNTSLSSASVSATTFAGQNDTPAVDTTPPIISSIETVNVIGSGAQIKWTTDDPSNSSVVYGTVSASYPLTSAWRCDAGGNVLNHCVNLTELIAGTPYFYQVISKNSAGGETKSAEQTFNSAAKTVSEAATTTPTALTPIIVSVKMGIPRCQYEHTVAELSFLSNLAGSAYFTLSGGALASLETFTDGSGTVMPSGNYTWKADPKPGYSVSGNASGTFSIPSLDSCLPVVNTTTIPTTTTAITVPIAEENPHAYIALWQGDTHIAAGQAIAGKIRINIGVEDADSVSVYLKMRDLTEPKFLGAAVHSVERPALWRFSWDSTTVPDEEAIIFSRVKNTAGEYRGDSIFINIKNNIQIPPPIIIPPPIVSGGTLPAGNSIIQQPHSDEPAIAENEQPKKYREVEDLLRQKYKEAETLFRKENKLPAGKETDGEEKQKIAEKIHEQFPALAASENSILLGTTTLSRTEESAFVAANITRVMTERNEIVAFADTDDDGISDYDETRIYGTSPTVADTDGDGVKDGNEILAGANPREKVFVPIPRENPKENIQGIIPSSQILSVEKVEQVLLERDINNSDDTSSRVLIHGTGPKNSFVTIYIFSTPIVVTVKTDSDGKWTYTMDKELPDGNHEIYVAMTESAGKIIVKSDAIPFVKTAQAATLSSDFALAATAPLAEAPAGFFRGGTLALSFVVLLVILGLSFMIISFVSRKKDDSNV